MTSSPYVMSLSLNVLNHLGLNLYSNIPAVLSEVVANAYDADAERVTVDIDTTAKRIVVQDDGDGMSRDDVNDRFLRVGYERRTDGDRARTAKHNRPVMGRKGIGKLSLFSAAGTVEIHTIKDGTPSAFRMRVDDIRSTIGAAGGSGDYRPEPLDPALVDFAKGTRIVLTDLKKDLINTSAGLRKRLARRFTVVGASHNFRLFVGDSEVTVADRDYFHKLQYVWAYGSDAETEELLARSKNATYTESRPAPIFSYDPVAKTVAVDVTGTVDPAGVPEPESDDGTSTPDAPTPIDERRLTGWIGTVARSGALKDEGDNLNRVVLMVRGKLAHEDLLEELAETGIFKSYVIGEIEAPFLDLDNAEDIATSSRQRIIEGDERYQSVIAWLQSELKRIGNTWSDLRAKDGAKVAVLDPLIAEWFDTLKGDTRKRAERLFGKINQLTIDEPRERAELFSHAVLAFETLRHRDALDRLDDVQADDLDAFTRVFADISDIESALYYQIASERILVIDKLQEQIQDDVLEKVLQQHLYDNLWLLDPGWERATDASIEERVGTAFKEIKLTKEENDSRMDIRYKRTSGAHVIVELKRHSVVTDTFTLVAQVDKYRAVLIRYLESIGKQEPVTAVCVIGRDLRDWDTTQRKSESIAIAAQKGIRIVSYEELLANARAGYREYLNGRKDLGRIRKLLDDLAAGATAADASSPASSASAADSTGDTIDLVAVEDGTADATGAPTTPSVPVPD